MKVTVCDECLSQGLPLRIAAWKVGARVKLALCSEHKSVGHQTDAQRLEKLLTVEIAAQRLQSTEIAAAKAGRKA